MTYPCTTWLHFHHFKTYHPPLRPHQNFTFAPILLENSRIFLELHLISWSQVSAHTIVELCSTVRFWNNDNEFHVFSFRMHHLVWWPIHPRLGAWPVVHTRYLKTSLVDSTRSRMPLQIPHHQTTGSKHRIDKIEARACVQAAERFLSTRYVLEYV